MIINTKGAYSICKLDGTVSTNIIVQNTPSTNIFLVITQDNKIVWSRPTSITGDADSITVTSSSASHTYPGYKALIPYILAGSTPTIELTGVVEASRVLEIDNTYDFNGLYLGDNNLQNPINDLRDCIENGKTYEFIFKISGTRNDIEHYKPEPSIKFIHINESISEFEEIKLALIERSGYTKVENASMHIITYVDGSIWVYIYEVIDSLQQEYVTVTLSGEAKTIQIKNKVDIDLLNFECHSSDSFCDYNAYVLFGFPILNGVVKIAPAFHVTNGGSVSISYMSVQDYADLARHIHVGSGLLSSINPTVLDNINDAISNLEDYVDSVKEDLEDQFNTIRQVYVSR